MTNNSTNTETKDQSRELERLVRKADHLSSLGTLTSLVSTLVYFVEQQLEKRQSQWKIPTGVITATLASVGIGILGVIASFYYKFKAGNIALYSREYMDALQEKNARPPAPLPPVETQPEVDSEPRKIWKAATVESRQPSEQSMGIH